DDWGAPGPPPGTARLLRERTRSRYRPDPRAPGACRGPGGDRPAALRPAGQPYDARTGAGTRGHAACPGAGRRALRPAGGAAHATRRIGSGAGDCATLRPSRGTVPLAQGLTRDNRRAMPGRLFPLRDARDLLP